MGEQMIKSMTGFGRCEICEDNRKFTVEMKSVNHRYLDVNLKMPKKLNFFEAAIRNLLKEYIQRGKVDVFITYEDLGQEKVSIRYNKDVAAKYLDYLRQMSADFGLEDDTKLSSLARFPEVFSALAPKTDCIFVPANWPERRKLHWCSLLTARAIENQVYVAGINCVGTQDGLHYSGDSRFIAPDGTILQDCRSAAGCFVCDLSAKTVAETRQTFPVQKDRRPDFYRSILL